MKTCSKVVFFHKQRTDGERENLADFLYTYLTRRFGLEQMVVEWAYNMHDAAQRYSHDEHIGLFWGILTGDVCTLICIIVRH